MKPYHVGTKTTIINGNEVDSKLYCCEVALNEIERLRKLKEHIKAINDLFNSKGIVIIDTEPLKYNYCPICGNKIKRKIPGKDKA